MFLVEIFNTVPAFIASYVAGSVIIFWIIGWYSIFYYIRILNHLYPVALFIIYDNARFKTRQISGKHLNENYVKQSHQQGYMANYSNHHEPIDIPVSSIQAIVLVMFIIRYTTISWQHCKMEKNSLFILLAVLTSFSYKTVLSWKIDLQ